MTDYVTVCVADCFCVCICDNVDVCGSMAVVCSRVRWDSGDACQVSNVWCVYTPFQSINAQAGDWCSSSGAGATHGAAAARRE